MIIDINFFFVTEPCQVIEEECNQILKPCVFPFVIENELRFDECTSYKDSSQANTNGGKWCATKTNSTNNKIIDKHWGYCKGCSINGT